MYGQMASEKSVNCESSDDLEETPSESLVTSDDSIIKTNQRRWCDFPSSPYPMYIGNVLYFLPMSVNSLAFDDVIYNKLCYQHFQNTSLCSNSTFTSNHPALQADAAIWGNYHSLCQLPLALIVNLMLCSYCDKVGHKLPYVLPIVGSCVATFYLALLASPQFLSWPMGAIIGYSLLSTVFGYYPMILMSSFSYVALVTPKEKRSVSMAICEGTLLVGVLIGNLISGPIIDNWGLTTLTYINAGLTLLPLPVVLIFLTDVTSHSSSEFKWRDMIGVRHLLDAFKCIFKKREGHTRLLLNLSFAAYSCSFVAINGFMAVSFLYFIKERGMSFTEYSLFNSFMSALKGIGGPLVLMIVKRLFNPSISNIAMFAGAMMAFSYIVMPIDAISPYGVWIGGAMTTLQTVLFAIIRTIQIGFCDPDELGKLFAYDAMLQQVVGTGTNLFYKTIYSVTVAVWPAMFLSFSSLMYIITMVLLVIIFHIKAIDDAKGILQ